MYYHALTDEFSGLIIFRSLLLDDLSQQADIIARGYLIIKTAKQVAAFTLANP